MIKRYNILNIVILAIITVFANTFYTSSQTLVLNDFNPVEISEMKECCSMKMSCCGKSTCQCSVDNHEHKNDKPGNEGIIVEKIDGRLSFAEVVPIYTVQAYLPHKMVSYNAHAFKPPNIAQNIETIVIRC